MDFRDRHVDAPLTNFALGYRPSGFIAEQVCPVVPVAKLKNTYPIFGTENLKYYDTLRDPKDKGKTWDQSLSTTTYHCKPHTIGREINDDDREAVPNGGNLETEIVQGNMDIMLINQEKEVATLMTTYTNYSSSTYYTTLSGTDQWDDPGGTSDPKKVITDAIETVRKGTLGRPANSIIITAPIAKALARHPKVIAEIKYTNPSLLSQFGLPPTLWGLNIFYGNSMYDATREGQTGHTGTDLWGDYAVVFYLNTAVGWYDMTFCKTFRHGQLGYYVKRIDMGPEYIKNLQKIETVDEGRDSKMICNTAGFLIQDCLV